MPSPNEKSTTGTLVVLSNLKTEINYALIKRLAMATAVSLVIGSS